MRRKIAVIGTACAMATGFGAATTASADSLPASCSSGHQIGGTAHITFHGDTAASIKQYYGWCDGGPRNWAYVWVWGSFRAKYPGRVQALAAIEDDTPPDGGDWSGSVGYRKVQEIISKPVATTHDCTRAVGFVSVRLTPKSRVPEEMDGYTGQRC
jgi:hypothetical protein